MHGPAVRRPVREAASLRLQDSARSVSTIRPLRLHDQARSASTIRPLRLHDQARSASTIRPGSPPVLRRTRRRIPRAPAREFVEYYSAHRPASPPAGSPDLGCFTCNIAESTSLGRIHRVCREGRLGLDTVAASERRTRRIEDREHRGWHRAGGAAGSVAVPTPMQLRRPKPHRPRRCLLPLAQKHHRPRQASPSREPTDRPRSPPSDRPRHPLPRQVPTMRASRRLLRPEGTRSTGPAIMVRALIRRPSGHVRSTGMPLRRRP